MSLPRRLVLRSLGTGGSLAALVCLLSLLVSTRSASAAITPVYSYPGSVENIGMTGSKAPRFYDAASLAARLVLKDSPAAAAGPLTHYAEPEVDYTMVGRRTIRTGKTRRSLTAYEMKPGQGRITWQLGKLPIGAYMLRVIGAIPTKDVGQPPKQLVFEMRVNDGLHGETDSYVLRGRGVDTMYCLEEFGFHVVDDRALKIEILLLDDSQAPAYVYNLEVHNILAGCAEAAGKDQPGLYTLEERDKARAAYAQTDAGRKAIAVAKAARPLSPMLRARRDHAIWNSLPSANTMLEENYIPVIGRAPAIKIDSGRTQNDDSWWLHRIYGGEYGSGWDQPWEAAHDARDKMSRHPLTARDIYTLADFRAHKPMGDTGDRGWGVIKNGRLVAPLARINSTAMICPWRCLAPDKLDACYLAGDENFARDMAFYLVRYAWWLPTYSLYHCIEYPTFEADTPWMQTRYYQSKFMNHQFALAYDRLFPFIKDNQELADAVGRFIPWVKKPEDLIKLLDTNLVQYVAKNMLYYRYYYDNDSADIMLQLAAVQANAKISEPWMEFLWSRVYFYPIGHQPLPDVLSVNSQRDGTSPIGSSFYAGTPATSAAQLIEPYLRAGGDPKYDLRDFQRYLRPSPAATGRSNRPLPASGCSASATSAGRPSPTAITPTRPKTSAAVGPGRTIRSSPGCW